MSERAKRFFSDMLPEKSFKPIVRKKEDVSEICRILSEECGIRGRHLAIKGEGKVTD